MESVTTKSVLADDGVGLAYWLAGSGPRLLWLDVPFFSDAGYEARVSPTREFYERLAECFTVLRMDFRGSGASERDIDPLEFNTLCTDVLSVADGAGFEKFALFGRDASGAIALQVAAAYPDRVEALVLYGAWSHGSALPVHPRMEAMERLLDVDWPMYTEAVARVVMGVGDVMSEMVAKHLQRCVTPQVWRQASELVRSIDVQSAVPNIRARTLVLYPEKGALAPRAASEELASKIHGAALVDVPGPQVPFGDPDETIGPIADLLGVARPRPRRRSAGIRVILWTDLERHTEIMSRLGDERGRSVLRAHEQAIRLSLRDHGGEEIKTTGDGFFASFASVAEGLRCAMDIQNRLAALPADELGLADPLGIRIGLNAGEPIAEDNDLFGASVITASRIAAQASGGRILVSDVVRLLATGGGFRFERVGETSLKGIDEPVVLWELVP